LARDVEFRGNAVGDVTASSAIEFDPMGLITLSRCNA
jgi:hypothetical protein